MHETSVQLIIFFGSQIGGGGYVQYIRKALGKGFSDMYGSWGVRWPPKKVIQPVTRTGQGILARFQEC